MIYLFEKLELDDSDFCLFHDGRRVPLEPRALRVLLFFVQNPGKLLQKDFILESVWKATFVEESTLTRAVTILRKQLGDDSRAPTYIETVPTLGYRFIAKVETSSTAGASETHTDTKPLVSQAQEPQMRPLTPGVEQDRFPRVTAGNEVLTSNLFVPRARGPVTQIEELVPPANFAPGCRRSPFMVESSPSANSR